MCSNTLNPYQKYKSLIEKKSKDNDKEEERMNNGGKSSIGFDDPFLKAEEVKQCERITLRSGKEF